MGTPEDDILENGCADNRYIIQHSKSPLLVVCSVLWKIGWIEEVRWFEDGVVL
jgi:hypothetical protein